MYRTALASVAASIALCAAPAAAQNFAGAQPVRAYFNLGKTEAIIGGQSRMAAILAQQSGQPLPPSGAAPASYTVPAAPAAMPLYRPAISLDRPDVFNSVALPIKRTSLDRRWRKAANGPVGGASASYAARLADLDPIERLEAVNRYVNARVRFVDDIKQYGVTDRWTTAADTLRRGRGDCEDYAIAKLQLLRRAGFADKDLYFVILRDALRRADHAVLVVRAEGRLLVLDNGTDRLIDSHDMPDYRPIFTFSGDQAWIHGYRRDLPPVEYAANGAVKPTVTIASASLAPAAAGSAPAN